MQNQVMIVLLVVGMLSACWTFTPLSFPQAQMLTLLCSCPAVVPAGYYLKGPGQIAPCPKGEWKSGTGTNGNCTKCAFGVTTSAEASISIDNCTIVVQGYYAAAVSNGIVTSTLACPQVRTVGLLGSSVGENLSVPVWRQAVLFCFCPVDVQMQHCLVHPYNSMLSLRTNLCCPCALVFLLLQSYFCPGGIPKRAFTPATPNPDAAGSPGTIFACPQGTWTQDIAATNVEQCREFLSLISLFLFPSSVQLACCRQS
jgi:hypothetical protein